MNDMQNQNGNIGTNKKSPWSEKWIIRCGDFSISRFGVFGMIFFAVCAIIMVIISILTKWLHTSLAALVMFYSAFILFERRQFTFFVKKQQKHIDELEKRLADKENL